MSGNSASASGTGLTSCALPRHDARSGLSRGSPGYWIQTVAVVENSRDVTRVRETYEGLLEQYPDNVSVQLAYIQYFLDNSISFNDAGLLFERFISTSVSVDLWKQYLRFVRRQNQASCAPHTVCSVYDRALDRVGHDYDSGDIWVDYIEFLDGVNVAGDGEMQSTSDTLRRVYHKAVAVPLRNVRELWSRLQLFETRYSGNSASTVLAALRAAYIQACTAVGELSTHRRGLDEVRQRPGNQLFLPGMPTFSVQDRALVVRWKSYLKWEEGDPLNIACSDNKSYLSRVWTAYHKALIRMYFYPEIWYTAFRWLLSAGKRTKALALLAAGLNANPDSFLLTYAYAEYVEMLECAKADRDFNDVHRVYERLFEALRAQLIGSVEVASAVTVTRNQDGLIERKKLYSNAWINYLRFICRTEGMQAYRLGFGKARRDEFVGSEVFESAAMTEYYCNLEDGRVIAARIFQAGLKKFTSDASYVLAYLNFLLSIDDDNNARALFETVIKTFTASEAKPIWTRWYQFRCRYDALDAVLELERRMAEVYPNDGFMKHFGARYAYRGFDAIAERDLGWSKVLRPSLTPIESVAASGSSSVIVGNGGGSSYASCDNRYISSNEEPPQYLQKRRRLYEQDVSFNSRHGRREFADSSDFRRRQYREEVAQKPVALPSVIEDFMRQLPPAASFDGPVLAADSMIVRLRETVVPNTETSMLSASSSSIDRYSST